MICQQFPFILKVRHEYEGLVSHHQFHFGVTMAHFLQEIMSYDQYESLRRCEEVHVGAGIYYQLENEYKKALDENQPVNEGKTN